MSWFDTKGLASLAKTALKEAQKQIDKALDIQEQPTITSSTSFDGEAGTGFATGEKQEKRKVEPNPSNVTTTTESLSRDESTATTDDVAPAPIASYNTWGSFSGSFFDNTNTNEMVTIPPKASHSTELSPVPVVSNFVGNATTNMVGMKRQSVTSNSDSVEVLSPPNSTCSELPSPSEGAARDSDSIELITAPSTSDIDTPSGASLPDSIVIISGSAADYEDDDEETMSYNTVMDDTLKSAHESLLVVDEESKLIAASDPSKPHLTAVTCQNSSNAFYKLQISMDDTPFETQTIDSDSTQSFEDVQASGFCKDTTLYNASEDGCNARKTSSQNYSSPPNSNDEMETTTSSDIEIISNPNGDSSSTNSTTRTSPLKMKKFTNNQSVSQGCGSVTKKGHFREPSEISILSEDSQSEADKLVQRLNELNEILEARELQLQNSERQNAALQERNNELQTAIQALKRDTPDSAEEYTHRLSALEKKFQANIRERDSLRIEVKTLKEELQSKIPKKDLSQVVAESNTMINELRLEGEKLSKEILQQSNIIKKLRAKEKTSDALLKKNKEQISSQTEELERLNKTLSAKEEVERSQIEAVHKMSSEKRKLEEENMANRSKIEDLQSKLTCLQASFDAVKVELQQRSRLHSDLTRSTEEAMAAKKEKDITKAENQEMVLQIQELREKLLGSEGNSERRIQQLRKENMQLMMRLEEAELRVEISAQEVSLTTAPLIRQLESLQNTLTQRTAQWNREEKSLLEKLDTSQSKLKSLENIETTYKEKLESLTADYMDLKEKLSHAVMQEERLKIALHQAELDCKLKETNLNRQITSLSDTLAEHKEKVTSLEESNKTLKENVRVKRDTSGSDELAQQDLSANTLTEVAGRPADQQLRSQSPAVSCGINSLEEAMYGSADWQTDDFDCISNSERQSTGFVNGLQFSFMGHNTSTLEHLQSLLKQRDGENNHLQWELSRLQAERNMLTEEISNLTLDLESVKDKVQSYELMEKKYEELEHRYDSLLQMYGEKVERTEELELDLIELKEAYKTQINELLGQPQSDT